MTKTCFQEGEGVLLCTGRLRYKAIKGKLRVYRSRGTAPPLAQEERAGFLRQAPNKLTETLRVVCGLGDIFLLEMHISLPKGTTGHFPCSRAGSADIPEGLQKGSGFAWQLGLAKISA